MSRNRVYRVGHVLVAIVVFAGVGFAQSGSKSAVTVDGQDLIDQFGDDRVMLEVNVGSWLLKPIIESDPELQEAVGGLESIYALIIDLSERSVAEAAELEVAAIEKRLIAGGWERVVRVREQGTRIKVLIKPPGDGEIGGLVVLLLDTEDDEEPVLVFAKIAGTIDIAALEKLGEAMDVPGLSDIEWKD